MNKYESILFSRAYNELNVFNKKFHLPGILPVMRIIFQFFFGFRNLIVTLWREFIKRLIVMRVLLNMINKVSIFHSINAILVLIVFIISCSKPPPFDSLTEYGQFQFAKESLRKRKYTTASLFLERFLLVHPASAVRDSVMYLLGETRFQIEQYLLASSEFDRLIKDLPNSALVDDAMYKTGMCFFKMSPNYERDQEYTRLAIQKFQRLAEEYPDSQYLKDVNEKIALLRLKLAKKEFSVGQLYQKMEYPDAAIISYDRILTVFYDTEWAPLALSGKGECLMKLKKFVEANEIFKEFLEKYPKHMMANAVQDKLKRSSKRIPAEDEIKTSSRE